MNKNEESLVREIEFKDEINKLKNEVIGRLYSQCLHDEEEFSMRGVPLIDGQFKDNTRLIIKDRKKEEDRMRTEIDKLKAAREKIKNYKNQKLKKDANEILNCLEVEISGPIVKVCKGCGKQMKNSEECIKCSNIFHGMRQGVDYIVFECGCGNTVDSRFPRTANNSCKRCRKSVDQFLKSKEWQESLPGFGAKVEVEKESPKKDKSEQNYFKWNDEDGDTYVIPFNKVCRLVLTEDESKLIIDSGHDSEFLINKDLIQIQLESYFEWVNNEGS